ncbi:hypothetical protein [Phenylobacterium sp.]|jgi:cell shape-determining protein MreC|uniref:hypothetical protein n=1 Tax=Phenylobacterium sp. TaxID=1871053 RepID=UPI00120DC34C|nr:hypothetical protein [Phenylobacterium sp.]THD71114.1 MAG: hypothetical protein E8A12_02035 [Phenylobacterium sp.]
MTPQVPSVLAEMAQLLLRNAAPDVPAAERANALGLAAAVLGVAAEVWDEAAENLVAENRALAALLDDTVDEASLRLSALRVENQRLRERLIAAHIAAEEAGDLRRQNAIWAELIASTERRKLSISPV